MILHTARSGTTTLRLAGSLAKREGEQVKVFLIGDAASAGKAGQKVPQGYYNLEVMLRSVTKRGGEVGVCGTCMDARGIADGELSDATHRSSLDQLTDSDATHRSSLDQLTDWTQW